MSYQPMQDSASYLSVDYRYAGILTRLATANDQSIPFSEPATAPTYGSAQEQQHLDVDRVRDHDRPASLPRQIQTALGPFMALPGSVTEYEQSRIQIYISLGNLFFGMAERPRYSSTYATGVPVALHSAVGRQWICILVDETLNASRGEKQPSDAIVRQKRKGYQHLNEALRARNTQFEEAILALMIIGLEVGWFDNDRSRNLHSTAMDMLLRSRGSPREVLSTLTKAEPWYVSAQFALGKCHFSSRRRLDSVKDSWKADFLRILHATKPLCSGINVPWQDRDQPETCAQLQARMIRLSVEIGSKSQTQTANGVQLSVLLELALTMLQFADSAEMMMNYFQRLDFLSTGMFIGGGPGDAAYDLRASAMGPAFSCARRDVISAWCPAALMDSDTEIFTVHINALKMFQYLELEGRCLVMSRLSSWLIAGLPESGESLLTEAEMAGLEEQIVRTWIAARKNAKSWW